MQQVRLAGDAHHRQRTDDQRVIVLVAQSELDDLLAGLAEHEIRILLQWHHDRRNTPDDIEPPRGGLVIGYRDDRRRRSVFRHSLGGISGQGKDHNPLNMRGSPPARRPPGQ